MMLPAYALIAQGLQIHVAAFPFRKNGAGVPILRSMAIQGRCYVISIGAAYRRDNLPDSLAELHSPRLEQWSSGGSGIIDPNGETIAEANGNEETIVLAEGSLETIAGLKLWNDIGGHYSRPDIFQLSINRRPLERVKLLEPTDRSSISTNGQSEEIGAHELEQESIETVQMKD